MYTQFAYVFIIKLNDVARKLGFSPIIYNKKRKMFQVSQTGFNITFMTSYNIAFYVSLCIPYNIVLTRQTKDYQQFYYTIVVFILALLGAVLVIGFEYKSETSCELMNGIFLYMRKIKRE